MSRVDVTDEQIKAAQAGDSDAMWEIVQAFDPMFSSMIRSVAPGAGAEDTEDYLQEARAVLIQRIRDYDSDSSAASLSSFVFRTARRSIAEQHIRQSTALTVDPTTVLRVKRALWEAGGDVDKAWEELSENATPKNRIERERFMSVLDALLSVERLDGPAGRDGDESDLTVADVIADPEAELSGSVERQDYARWLMTQIPPRQAFALRALYGVNMTALTDPEAAAELGVTRNNLRQLRNAGKVSARKVAETRYWTRGTDYVTRLAPAA
ncbi:hypothetical protein [Streptomyces sp. NPDC086782]|uniref:hypothetical protein n=1 Tax=Streptomyces sp. NPDC086782 TaxID=3365757 RepID=UPI0038154284